LFPLQAPQSTQKIEVEFVDVHTQQTNSRPFSQLMKQTRRLAFWSLALAFLYFSFTFAQVWFAARKDTRKPADAIIVLGAAQYNGRPSPVLKDRLDHAITLYTEGVAEILVVTGGRQENDIYTEASTAADYLRKAGVPETAIRREVSSTNSYESLAASARFLAKENITEVVLVSDPYHAKRIADIAEEVGLDAQVSPAATKIPLRALVRETAAVGLGRLLGHRRLARISQAFSPRT